LKNTLFIFLFLWTALALAQTEKIKIKKEKEEEKKEEIKKTAPLYYGFGSFDFTYGQKIYAKNLYSQFNTFDSLDFNRPSKFIGFGISGYRIAVNPRNEFILKMLWNYVIPQEVRIHDTVKGKLKGFTYNLGWGKSLSTKKKQLSLTFYVGFNTGFTKITSGELEKQINPFFAPSLSLQPKVVLKRITISVLIDADYDVSNPAWKSFRSKEQSATINGFNQTGLSVIGTLGLSLYHL
jgi:hypothetical protein